MSKDFTLTATPGDALSTTCRACGASHEHPNYSVLVAWRAAHECPGETAAAQGKAGANRGNMSAAPSVGPDDAAAPSDTAKHPEGTP